MLQNARYTLYRDYTQVTLESDPAGPSSEHDNEHSGSMKGENKKSQNISAKISITLHREINRMLFWERSGAASL